MTSACVVFPDSWFFWRSTSKQLRSQLMKKSLKENCFFSLQPLTCNSHTFSYHMWKCRPEKLALWLILCSALDWSLNKWKESSDLTFISIGKLEFVTSICLISKVNLNCMSKIVKLLIMKTVLKFDKFQIILSQCIFFLYLNSKCSPNKSMHKIGSSYI